MNNSSPNHDDNLSDNDTGSDTDCDSISDSDIDSDDDADGEVLSQYFLSLQTNIRIALEAVRKIVRLFRKFPLKNTDLQNCVKEEHGKELNLLLDCRT